MNVHGVHVCFTIAGERIAAKFVTVNHDILTVDGECCRNRPVDWELARTQAFGCLDMAETIIYLRPRRLVPL